MSVTDAPWPEGRPVVITGVELAPEGIRCSVVDRIPMGRLGGADEVTSAVMFAASSAASLITGSSILTDGGWVAR